MTGPLEPPAAGAAGPPQRVRVTRPQNAARPTTVADEIDRQSEVGAIYMRSLMRAQLRLAVAVVAVLAVGIGAIPLLMELLPAVGRYRVAGVPLIWLVLGAGIYPVLIGLAVFYVRRAERNERIFAAMLGPADTPLPGSTVPAAPENTVPAAPDNTVPE